LAVNLAVKNTVDKLYFFCKKVERSIRDEAMRFHAEIQAQAQAPFYPISGYFVASFSELGATGVLLTIKKAATIMNGITTQGLTTCAIRLSSIRVREAHGELSPKAPRLAVARNYLAAIVSKRT
jgi:hypothetical protein